MICPKCGKEMETNICPECGFSAQEAEAPKNETELEKLIRITGNFSKRPDCSKEELEELSTSVLINLSPKEKVKYNVLIKNYLDNYLRGGTGVTLIEAAEPIISNDSDKRDPEKLKKPRFNKKQKRFLLVSCACLILLVGGIGGTIYGVKAYKAKHQVVIPQTVINFDFMDGNDGTKSITVNDGDIPESIVIPKKAGYTFKGYFSDKESGVKYFNENGYALDVWHYKSNRMTLYARWQAKKSHVTLEKVYGTGGASLITVTYDEMMPTIIVPHRSGYVFDGFYEKVNGEGKKYISNTGTGLIAWDNEEQYVTIYANWLS